MKAEPFGEMLRADEVVWHFQWHVGGDNAFQLALRSQFPTSPSGDRTNYIAVDCLANPTDRFFNQVV